MVELKWYQYHPKFYWRKITDFVRSIPAGVENVFRWLPVIWWDRQWDQGFFYSIMLKKLERMDWYWRKHKPEVWKKWGHEITGRDKNTAKNIRICIELIKRLIADDYTFRNPEMWKLHEKKFGSVFDRGYRDKNGNFCIPGSTDPDEKRDSKKMMDYETYMRKQDKQLLYKILETQLDTWWD